MKKHYDFSKAKHEPKFYRLIEKLIPPTDADKKVIEREQKAALAKTKKYRSSRILNEMHETATNLHKIGLIPIKKMREFDALCLAHPGEILKRDFMTPQNISVTQLAKGTGIPAKDIRKIIKGEMSIDVHDARALGEFFGNAAEYWINLHAGTKPKTNLTRSFRETVQKRATKDPKFRKGLLTEAVDAMLCGEVNVANSLLRDYISSGKIDITALRKSFDNFIRMAEDIQCEVGAKDADMCVECHLQENLRNPKFKAAYEREGKKIDRAVRKTTAKASAKKKK
jgi:addiction module HigA family antidote